MQSQKQNDKEKYHSLVPEFRFLRLGTTGAKILAAELQEYGSATVSEGTLKPADLIRKFAAFLEGLVAPEGTPLLSVIDRNASHYQTWEYYAESEEAGHDLGALWDRLHEYAPDGFYFGTHYGDGACFGFWPCEDND